MTALVRTGVFIGILSLCLLSSCGEPEPAGPPGDPELGKAIAVHPMAFDTAHSFYYCFRYLSPAFEMAKANGRPVMIVFDGHTVSSCRKMEQKIMESPSAMSLINDHFIPVRLMVDESEKLPVQDVADGVRRMKNRGDFYLTFQTELFRINAQPFYVILSPDGKLLHEPFGYTPSASDFKSYLLEALEAYEKNEGFEDADFIPRLNAWLEREEHVLASGDSTAMLSPDAETPSFHISRTDCSIPEGPATLTPMGDKSYSKWTVSVSGKPCKGNTVTLTFSGKPEADWHLYSSDGTGEIAYQPTEFWLDAENSSAVKSAGQMKDLSTPKSEYDDLMGGTIRHYAGGQAASFSQELTILEDNPCVSGELNAQVCMENGMCVIYKAAFRWHPPVSACK